MSNELPYNGTSGWSGTDTSYERMVNDDRSGRTARHHERALRILKLVGAKGVTWKELDWRAGFNHHGRTSGVLTVLHKQGRIVRLKERRDRCHLYVLPEHAGDRTIDQPALRMTQTDMRTYLEWSLRHAKVWGDSKLEEETTRLLNMYWPERNDVEMR